MSCHRRSAARATLAVLAAGCVLSGAASSGRQLPIEPLKDSGQNVYPAFEGWYQNADGSYSLLLGYYNRNAKEVLDIPVGPNNQIQPGGPDQGQPTHFLARRGWGVVAIKVPKDFGDKKIVWTLTANGRTAAIPFGLVKGYQIEPYKDAALGNTPPVLKFDPAGPALQGPPLPLSAAHAMSAVAAEPATITVWATDDDRNSPPTSAGATGPRRPRLSVVLSQYRGPGTVTFADATPEIDKDGKATTTATFAAPGDYVIRVEGNDSSGVGGGGFQCCWTTGYINVSVKGAGTTGG